MAMSERQSSTEESRPREPAARWQSPAIGSRTAQIVKSEAKTTGTTADLTSAVIILKTAAHSVDKPHRIRCMNDLKARDGMETICRSVFEALGKKQPEAAYQRALQVELEIRGVTVDAEIPMRIVYLEAEISSRRIDLLLRLADGSRAIVETKAVKTLNKGANSKALTTTNYAQQIEYYMDVFNVEHGFLVNFPHEAGFPRPPSGATFRQENLCGMTSLLSDMHLRDHNKEFNTPEIVYFRKI